MVLITFSGQRGPVALAGIGAIFVLNPHLSPSGKKTRYYCIIIDQAVKI